MVQQGEPRNYIVLVSKIVSRRFYPTTPMNDVEDRRILSQRQRTLLLIAQQTA